MSFIIENGQILTIGFGILIALTNIIVEVIKSFFQEHNVPTNIVAVVTAVALTVVASIGYASFNAIDLVWFDYIAMAIYGILVGYGAMFGYDKLKEIIDKFKPKA